MKSREQAKKLLETLAYHKRLLSQFATTKNLKLMTGIVRTGEELTLAIADYKCQRCKFDNKLQFHHLIMRPDAHYINDKIRYLSQRHYWGNVIILCERCHNEYHHMGNIERDEKAFISKKKIQEIKQKYGG